jgi:hypothetical protein
LTWTGQGFSTTVQLDSSMDLSQWQPFRRDLSVVDLRFGEHHLLQNRLNLGSGHLGKYLRLSWPPGTQGVQLSGVEAGLSPEGPVPHRRQVTGHIEETGQRSWTYHSQGFFPVDQVHVRLAEENSLAKLTLFSSTEAKGPWTQRASLLAWKLRLEGTKLHNASHSIRLTTDPWWRIEMEEQGTAPLAAPLLDLAGRPDEILFLAQGEGPYTLAYGRAGLLPQPSQVEQLLKLLDPVLQPAVAGPEKLLGGRERLLPVRERNWQGWLLWLALLAGLAMVAGMALRLWQEMSRRKD